ncbi:MAG: type III-B CRISPR module RAMP protein Cmr6 [Planctomycetia bacterium]|nr:type III-B CRISPR module RAMP protein Cmr6 [Planctomycetia bacterium]
MNRPLYHGSQSAAFDRNKSNTGLWYDKFCNTWNGNWIRPDNEKLDIEKLDWIKSVVGTVGSNDQLTQHAARQRELATKLGGLALPFVTATRFATGLGREHPIEIGFAWHHTLGTPYLPGSSVKGVLRAYVRECFGKEVASDLFGPDDFKAEHCVGKWIFFDAIPSKPVTLEADVMTPHYGPYYQGDAAPGDWHNPVPIPFLAVAREQQFQFAFAPRGNDSYTLPDGTHVDNDKIAEWLTAALHWLGAGAKTNSGFGVFRPAEESSLSNLVSGKALAAGSAPDGPSNKPASSESASSKAPGQRLNFNATLELVTPAFLAGADQTDATDCDLRPATLRGQLRYWWRTLHAGYLTVAELRSLEAALWGSTKEAGAIRVVVQRRTKGEQQPDWVPGKREALNKKDQRVLRLAPDFAKVHDLAAAPQRRTQGFLYLSFGMDEMPAGKPNERKRRRCRLPGSEWEISVVVRAGYYLRPGAAKDETPQSIDASVIETQALAALSLLCQFGGVGSKSRNGYGSLKLSRVVSETLEHKRALTPEEAEESANKLRASEKLRLTNSPLEPSELSVFNDRLMLAPIPTPWLNYWKVLDELGFAIQDFGQSDGQKRTWIKEAFGLPRKIGQSDNDGRAKFAFSGSTDKTQQAVVWLGQHHPHLDSRRAEDMRHASPIHLHISRNDNGTHSIGVIAFPNRILPDYQTSRDELQALIEHLQIELPKRIAKSGPPKPLPKTSIGTASASIKRPSGTPVKVTIVSVREKGGFEVQEEGRPKGVLNLGPVPTLPPSVSDVVEVQIKDDTKSPQYQWPKPATAASTKSSNGKKK